MITPRHTPIKSQSDKVKEHMLAGNTIDTWQAYKLYKITCLAQRIYDLKQAGISISSKTAIQNGKTFSIYWLDRDVIQSYQQNSNSSINESVKSEVPRDVK